MITSIQALILGAIQGVSELFPVSSLGHSIIIPSLLHWNIAQSSNYFVLFLVATHLATALVLLGFFFTDWKKIIQGIVRSLKNRYIHPHDTYEKMGWLLIVATIPAGLLGLLFEQQITALFSAPAIVALFLIANGILLYLAEIISRRRTQQPDTHDDSRISQLSWTNSLKIGLAQSLALIPGFSRTGATLGGGLLTGLNHEDAARFSFLLATPIILAAALLKLPELVGHQLFVIKPILIGFLAAGVSAYLSVRFLTRYFKKSTLTPFAIYCVSMGVLAFALLVR